MMQMIQMLIQNKVQQIPQNMMNQLEQQLKRQNPQAYKKYQEARGFDIAAAVRIVADDVIDLNLAKAIEKQKAEHPFFSHYDSIAVTK